jgi:hypothetical protein
MQPKVSHDTDPAGRGEQAKKSPVEKPGESQGKTKNFRY